MMATALAEEEKSTQEIIDTLMIRENIKRVYKFGRVVGNGKFGVVRIACPQDESKQKQRFAVKSIPRAKIGDEETKMLEQELNILRRSDHPNII